jgi:hypothetical protein
MSDHALGVAGLILGIAGILIGALTSYYFYMKSRERIEPRYLLQHEPLLGSSSGAMNEVTLLFKGQKITNLNRCLLLIWNRGSRTLSRSAVVDSDKVRVSLPEGSKVLGVGIAQSTRPAIGLTASVDEPATIVTVDFDFLDKGDGGVIEILYQGNPSLKPKLVGSIRGVPQGLKSMLGTLSLDDEEDDDAKGTWNGWLPSLIALCLLAAGSITSFGISYPLTVVLLTVLAEVILVTVLFATLTVVLRWVVGFPELWKETPEGVGNPRIKID